VAIVLHRREHQADVVAAACGLAAARGVRAGMTLAHARALMPPKSCIEAIDEHDLAYALRRFAVAMLRWVPVVSIDGADGVLCDATGCERMYRGIGPLVQRVATKVRRWGLAVRVAAAPTYGAAWAITRFGPAPETVLTPETLVAALQDLPLEALRLDGPTVDKLHAVGLERIGQLQRVARAALADRYGPDVLRRLDQALGHAPEVITPIRTRPPVKLAREFEGPTSHLESLMLAARQLAQDISAKLLALESGCRQLELRLDRSDLEPLALTIRTAKPTRDAKHLWALLAPKLESAHLGFGVQGMTMHAKGLARLAHAQVEEWTTARDDEAAVHVGRLIDTLNARLGVGAVLALRINESHRPEGAFARDALVSLPEIRPYVPQVIDADRPSILYDEPQAIEVTLHVPDGPIAMVRHAGEVCRVVEGDGPERIEPEWWRPKTAQDIRDYFKVAAEDGRVLWIFRSQHAHTEAWFLHGVWA
jgi:protein ImuB